MLCLCLSKTESAHEREEVDDKSEGTDVDEPFSPSAKDTFDLDLDKHSSLSHSPPEPISPSKEQALKEEISPVYDSPEAINRIAVGVSPSDFIPEEPEYLSDSFEKPSAPDFRGSELEDEAPQPMEVPDPIRIVQVEEHVQHQSQHEEEEEEDSARLEYMSFDNMAFEGKETIDEHRKAQLEKRRKEKAFSADLEQTHRVEEEISVEGAIVTTIQDVSAEHVDKKEFSSELSQSQEREEITSADGTTSLVTHAEDRSETQESSEHHESVIDSTMFHSAQTDNSVVEEVEERTVHSQVEHSTTTTTMEEQHSEELMTSDGLLVFEDASSCHGTKKSSETTTTETVEKHISHQMSISPESGSDKFVEVDMAEIQEQMKAMAAEQARYTTYEEIDEDEDDMKDIEPPPPSEAEARVVAALQIESSFDSVEREMREDKERTETEVVTDESSGTIEVKSDVEYEKLEKLDFSGIAASTEDDDTPVAEEEGFAAYVTEPHESVKDIYEASVVDSILDRCTHELVTVPDEPVHPRSAFHIGQLEYEGLDTEEKPEEDDYLPISMGYRDHTTTTVKSESMTVSAMSASYVTAPTSMDSSADSQRLDDHAEGEEPTEEENFDEQLSRERPLEVMSVGHETLLAQEMELAHSGSEESVARTESASLDSEDMDEPYGEQQDEMVEEMQVHITPSPQPPREVQEAGQHQPDIELELQEAMHESPPSELKEEEPHKTSMIMPRPEPAELEALKASDSTSDGRVKTSSSSDTSAEPTILAATYDLDSGAISRVVAAYDISPDTVEKTLTVESQPKAILSSPEDEVFESDLLAKEAQAAQGASETDQLDEAERISSPFEMVSDNDLSGYEAYVAVADTREETDSSVDVCVGGAIVMPLRPDHFEPDDLRSELTQEEEEISRRPTVSLGEESPSFEHSSPISSSEPSDFRGPISPFDAPPSASLPDVIQPEAHPPVETPAQEEVLPDSPEEQASEQQYRHTNGPTEVEYMPEHDMPDEPMAPAVAAAPPDLVLSSPEHPCYEEQPAEIAEPAVEESEPIDDEPTVTTAPSEEPTATTDSLMEDIPVPETDHMLRSDQTLYDIEMPAEEVTASQVMRRSQLSDVPEATEVKQQAEAPEDLELEDTVTERPYRSGRDALESEAAFQMFGGAMATESPDFMREAITTPSPDKEGIPDTVHVMSVYETQTEHTEEQLIDFGDEPLHAEGGTDDFESQAAEEEGEMEQDETPEPELIALAEGQEEAQEEAFFSPVVETDVPKSEEAFDLQPDMFDVERPKSPIPDHAVLMWEDEPAGKEQEMDVDEEELEEEGRMLEQQASLFVHAVMEEAQASVQFEGSEDEDEKEDEKMVQEVHDRLRRRSTLEECEVHRECHELELSDSSSEGDYADETRRIMEDLDYGSEPKHTSESPQEEEPRKKLVSQVSEDIPEITVTQHLHAETEEEDYPTSYAKGHYPETVTEEDLDSDQEHGDKHEEKEEEKPIADTGGGPQSIDTTSDTDDPGEYHTELSEQRSEEATTEEYSYEQQHFLVEGVVTVRSVTTLIQESDDQDDSSQMHIDLLEECPEEMDDSVASPQGPSLRYSLEREEDMIEIPVEHEEPQPVLKVEVLDLSAQNVGAREFLAGDLGLVKEQWPTPVPEEQKPDSKTTVDEKAALEKEPHAMETSEADSSELTSSLEGTVVSIEDAVQDREAADLMSPEDYGDSSSVDSFATVVALQPEEDEDRMAEVASMTSSFHSDMQSSYHEESQEPPLDHHPEPAFSIDVRDKQDIVSPVTPDAEGGSIEPDDSSSSSDKFELIEKIELESSIIEAEAMQQSPVEDRFDIIHKEEVGLEPIFEVSSDKEAEAERSSSHKTSSSSERLDIATSDSSDRLISSPETPLESPGLMLSGRFFNKSAERDDVSVSSSLLEFEQLEKEVSDKVSVDSFTLQVAVPQEGLTKTDKESVSLSSSLAEFEQLETAMVGADSFEKVTFSPQESSGEMSSMSSLNEFEKLEKDFQEELQSGRRRSSEESNSSPMDKGSCGSSLCSLTEFERLEQQMIIDEELEKEAQKVVCLLESGALVPSQPLSESEDQSDSLTQQDLTLSREKLVEPTDMPKDVGDQVVPEREMDKDSLSEPDEGSQDIVQIIREASRNVETFEKEGVVESEALAIVRHVLEEQRAMSMESSREDQGHYSGHEADIDSLDGRDDEDYKSDIATAIAIDGSLVPAQQTTTEIDADSLQDSESHSRSGALDSDSLQDQDSVMMISAESFEFDPPAAPDGCPNPLMQRSGDSLDIMQRSADSLGSAGSGSRMKKSSDSSGLEAIALKVSPQATSPDAVMHISTDSLGQEVDMQRSVDSLELEQHVPDPDEGVMVRSVDSLEVDFQKVPKSGSMDSLERDSLQDVDGAVGSSMPPAEFSKTKKHISVMEMSAESGAWSLSSSVFSSETLKTSSESYRDIMQMSLESPDFDKTPSSEGSPERKDRKRPEATKPDQVADDDLSGNVEVRHLTIETDEPGKDLIDYEGNIDQTSTKTDTCMDTTDNEGNMQSSTEEESFKRDSEALHMTSYEREVGELKYTFHSTSERAKSQETVTKVTLGSHSLQQDLSDSCQLSLPDPCSDSITSPTSESSSHSDNCYCGPESSTAPDLPHDDDDDDDLGEDSLSPPSLTRGSTNT